MKKNSIITGALILTCASLITRILGFIYRIYMSNTIGSEGMGLYQLITPIYALTWSISASGFSTAVSKLTAQENAKKEYGNMGRILKQSLLATGTISIAVSVILFFCAEIIGNNFLHDSRSVISLKVLSVCIPFMSMGSCIRGYFFGLQDSSIPAISQVFEQLVRMLVIFLLADKFIPLGLEYACLAAICGICFGEILSFFYVLISYKMFKNKNKINKKPSINSLQTFKNILTISLPLTANRVSSSFLATVENSLIPKKMIQYGYTIEEAISSYGELTGMAMPLLQFPTAFLMALSITLVPSISEAVQIKNKCQINSVISKTLQFTALIGIFVTVVFLAFSYEIGIAIYNNKKIGDLLFYISFLSPFLYLNIVMSGILNGLGEQVFIFKNNILSSLINILFIIFYIPRFGIMAYIFGVGIGMAVTSFLAVSKVLECCTLNFDYINWLIKPLFSISAVIICIKYIAAKYLFVLFPLFLGLIVVLFITGICYLTLLLLLGSIKLEDITKINIFK